MVRGGRVVVSAVAIWASKWLVCTPTLVDMAPPLNVTELHPPIPCDDGYVILAPGHKDGERR